MKKTFKIVKETRNITKILTIELAVIFSLLIIGGKIFSILEGWRFFDAVYFTVITVAGVGYGDFHPITDYGKVLAMAYALIGVPLFAFTTSVVIVDRMKKSLSDK